MSLSARRLNRATLSRQLLLHREPLDVVDAVHRVVALQAQEAASPYLALWNRLAAFDPADLDAAFATHAVVKASLMRLTLHAVDAEDYPAFRRAMERSLRASRFGDRRFTLTGLSIADVDDLVPQVIAFAARPRTNAEFQEWLDARLGVLPQPGAWWALRTFAPVVHAPTGGPWSFGLRPSYVATPSHPSYLSPADRDASIQRLVRRYLEGFGPASVLDVAQFTLLPRSVAREALRRLAETVDRLTGPDGAELFDVPGAGLPDEDIPAPPRLLGMGTASSSRTPTAAVSSRRTTVGRSSGRTVTSCRRCWWTVTSQGSGVRSTAASKRRRSTRCPTRRGRGWPLRPVPWWRSWRPAIPRSTAGTATGGPGCLAPRCRSSLVEWR